MVASLFMKDYIMRITNEIILTEADIPPKEERFNDPNYWYSPYRSAHPWAMYFIYAPEGNFILKGKENKDGLPSLNDYIKKHFPICLYRYTYWENGESRGSWRFSCPRMYVEGPSRRTNRKYEIVAFKELEKGRKVLTFRRIPKKWLPEYNELLEFAGVKVS